MPITDKNRIAEEAPRIARWRYFLPWLLSNITRRARYLPEIEWSEESWTHNAFRAYEWLFFRAYGKNGVGDTIRAESSVEAFVDEEGNMHIHRNFYTLEAAVAHVEGSVRSAWKELWKPRPEFGYMPQPVFLTLMILGVKLTLHGDANGALLPLIGGAIAYDNSNKGIANPGSSLTFSLTTSGSDRLLLLTGGLQDNSRSWSDMTYAGVSGTQIGSNFVYSANSAPAQLRYIIAPTTGANNAVFTPSGSITVRGIAVNYTGCKQSGQPDAFAQGSGSTSQNVNVVASNCWIISASISFNNQTTNSGAAGYVTLGGVLTQMRQLYDDGIYFADSGGTVSTGNQAYNYNGLNSNNGRIAASIAPTTAVPVTVNPTTLSAVFSLIAYTVSVVANPTVLANTLAATFSAIAPTTSADANVAVATQSATFSIPTYQVIAGNVNTAPSTLSMTFSIPAYTVTPEVWVTVPATTLELTFSTPAPVVDIGATVSPSTLSLAFSIPTYAVAVTANPTVTPSTLALTFSIPSPAVELGIDMHPNTLELTFTLPAYTVTVTASPTIAANTLVATFSLPTLDFVGGVWRKVPQATDEWDKMPIGE